MYKKKMQVIFKMLKINMVYETIAIKVVKVTNSGKIYLYVVHACEKINIYYPPSQNSGKLYLNSVHESEKLNTYYPRQKIPFRLLLSKEYESHLSDSFSVRNMSLSKDYERSTSPQQKKNGLYHISTTYLETKQMPN